MTSPTDPPGDTPSDDPKDPAPEERPDERIDERVVRRRQILDIFDTALDIPEAKRHDWLLAQHTADPSLIAAVEALLAADALAPSALPTELPGDDDDTTALVVPPRIGTYALVERLGGGGMGEVWLGRRDDGLFEHEVAVKLMRPSRLAAHALAFFDTERRVLARLRHRHIARLYDGGVTEQGLPWIVMEKIDGVTLDMWAARETPGVAQAVALMTTICEAVQYAHQNLVVHADLKPSNILITADGEPFLVDFGISSLAAPTLAEPDVGATTSAVPRTPGYASPQRLDGDAPVPADDIYALGIIMKGLLEGQWPGQEDRDAVTPSPPADLAAIVTKATAREAEARYTTAQGLADDLKAFAGHRPVKARTPDWLHGVRLFVRRHRWPVAAGVTATLATLIALVMISVLYVRAETRFSEVRALAGYMLGDFHDALERLPGASALRARTTDVGRDYLQRLSRVPGAPAEVQRDVAIGYGRVGHALAVNSSNATGDADGGLRALNASEAGLRRLMQRYPGRADIRRELARTLAWKSGVMAGSNNDLKAAYASVDEAIALYDGVLKANPKDIDAAYGRWNAVNGRGDLLYNDNRMTDIVGLMTDALARGRDLPDTAPYDSLKPLLTAASENAIGDATYATSPVEAVPRYKRAVAILQAARDSGVLDIRIAIRQAIYDYQVSSSYQDMGKPTEALTWADQGVALIGQVAQFDDSIATQRATNLLALNRAAILSDLGRVDEAVAVAGQSIAARRLMMQRHPGDSDIRLSLATSLRVYAISLDGWKRPAEACAAAREARALWAEMASHGGVPDRLKADVAWLDARLKTCAL